MAAFSVSRARVVFDGQSLNYSPASGVNYPRRVMGMYPGVPFNNNVAISGISWTQLSPSATQRTDPWANYAPFTVFVMCGGTTDVSGENDPGATVYADMVAYANARRAAGFDWVIATTITPSTMFTPAQDTERQNANTLILGDASAAFNGKADFAADPRLSDPNNTTYYSSVDHLHFTDAGAQAAAEVMYPVLGVALKVA